jgi:putative oxidoreductase
MKFLKTNLDKVYALLRIVAGAMFSLHGMQKILGLFGGMHGAPAFIRYGAGTIELVGGICIALGLFTTPIAFLASGEMAVAYFLGHVARTKQFWPIQNQGELAALYCWVFLFVAAKGSGIWSVDGSRGKR